MTTCYVRDFRQAAVLCFLASLAATIGCLLSGVMKAVLACIAITLLFCGFLKGAVAATQAQRSVRARTKR